MTQYPRKVAQVYVQNFNSVPIHDLYWPCKRCGSQRQQHGHLSVAVILNHISKLPSTFVNPDRFWTFSKLGLSNTQRILSPPRYHRSNALGPIQTLPQTWHKTLLFGIRRDYPPDHSQTSPSDEFKLRVKSDPASSLAVWLWECDG